MAIHCDQCDKEHVEKATCDKCGICFHKKVPSQLDERGKLISNEYPIIRCTNIVNGKTCNERSFWD